MRKIILASTSPRRKEILEKTGIPFVVESGDYEEDMSLKLKPRVIFLEQLDCQSFQSWRN